jgi:DNA ligase-1
MLANNWDTAHNLKGFLISEKLDGVRALWTGTALLTRTGGTYTPPAGWLTGLPAGVSLDGELWAGRGRFDEASGIARTGAASEASWARLTFMVFDAPAAAGGFEARLKTAERAIAGAPCARIHAHTVAADNAAVLARLEEVIALRGEGLMARR